MTRASDTTECRLCGLPAPIQETQEDGHFFCCFGCREVYRRFGDVVFSENERDSPQETLPEPQGNEAFLRIDGMHCSSCELLIEKVAMQTDGVLWAASSYATSTARIIYDPDLIDEPKLTSALSQSGYHARSSHDKAPEYEEGFAFLRLMVAESLAATIMMLYVAFFYPAHLGLVEFSEFEPVHWLAFKTVPMIMFLFTTILVLFAGAPILSADRQDARQAQRTAGGPSTSCRLLSSSSSSERLLQLTPALALGDLAPGSHTRHAQL